MSEAVSDSAQEQAETKVPGSGEDLVGAARRRVTGAPDDVDARLELARLFMERGDWELALEQIDAALEREPENVDLVVDRGIALTGAARLVDAERDLRTAQRLDPERGRVYTQLGKVLFKRGLYRQAEAELRRAIELDERDGDAYFYLGESLNQLGRFDDALTMLERAVQYQPKNAKAYYTMGILYDRKHLRQEATTMYRKAREVGAA